MKSVYIFIFMFLVLCSFASAKVATTSTPYEAGYIIEGTPQEYIKSNTNFTYSFFLRNITDGKMIDNSTTNCSFYMANSVGNVVVYIPQVTYDSLDYWNLNISGGNFTDDGYYSYDVKCNGLTVGGAIVGYFYSYESRMPTDYKGQDGSIIAIAILLIFIIALGAFLTFYMESGLKFAFFLGTVLTTVFSLNVIANIASNSSVTITVVNLLWFGYNVGLYIFWGLFLFVLYKLTVGLKIQKNPPPTMGSPLKTKRKERLKRQGRSQ